MAPRDQNPFWRKGRIILRRCRVTVLVLILALLGSLLYLNQVGLPDFIKRPLQEKLRARGLDLQFTRLRWRWQHGMVAENVRFGPTNQISGPKFSVQEAQVQLDYGALAKLHLQVNGLVLRQGRLIWQMAATNRPARELSVDNVQAELRLLPGDLWALDNFQAQFAGAKIQLTGAVTNASAVRDWKIFQQLRPAEPGTLEARLRELADVLEWIHFSAPPQLTLDVRGDALDLQSFAVRLAARTPDADTPWGTLQYGSLSILLRPATSNTLSHAEINLQANSAETRWASGTNLALTLHLLSMAADPNMVHVNLDLTAESVETPWSQANQAHFTAEWLHAITNAIPLSGRCELQAENARTEWGSTRQVSFAAQLLLPTNTPAATDETWGGWTNLAPYALAWNCRLKDLQATGFVAEAFSCAGEWRAPDLTLTRISSTLYDGSMDAQAALNVATREFTFTTTNNFDAQKISPLLTEKSRAWLAQFSWKKPPVVNTRGSLILPAWTNLLSADWRGEVRPTVHLDGNFQVADGAFRNVPFSSVESHFSYADLTWRLPDLVARLPDGWLTLVHESNEQTKDFYFRVRSLIDPHALRPLLEPGQQRGLDFVTFTQPPVIEGEIRGRWFEPERISARATVAVTNFQVRGEAIGSFQTAMEYTNGFLICRGPHAERGAEYARADSLALDFVAKKIYLTNGVGSLEAMAVPRMISSNVSHIMEPYHFLQPPTAHAEGIIPMRDPSDADLHFDIDGGPFEWWKFKVPRVAGRVDWVGDRLTLTNVEARFYQGAATGNAEFNFHREAGADFRFNLVATNADLHLLMADLSGKTNRLEGRLNIRLAITQGNSADLHSLQGSGRLRLRDGLIWDIPVFGILSPVLDTLAPGLGSSRASDGSVAFVITNGVARTDDLEIRASMMRLRYWGAVDLQGPVDARAQAELFRDTWVLGRVLSLALWPVSKIFEYKISGTLHEPKSEPVFFVPRIIMLPLHPIQTMKDLLAPEPDWSQTNAPVFAPTTAP